MNCFFESMKMKSNKLKYVLIQHNQICFHKCLIEIFFNYQFV